MDLTQAEAIADLISVESERARRNALSQLYGGLKREIIDIREGILNLLAELEVEIEFPDDEPMEANYSDWLEKTESLRKKIQKLVNRGISGRTIREGFRITIAGPPNSGKSTLLNALLGEDRAIVHNQPGTTRDILREAVEIEGIKIWLSDTAGLRNEAGEIEQEGIARAQKEIDTSDLTLYLIDLNNPVDDGFRFENKNMLKVGNKVDLTPGDGISCDLKISALKSIGLEQLKETIAEKALLNCSDSGVIANERHLKNLRSALKYVSEAKEIIAKKGETELIALELRSAGLSLGEIIGEGVTEEVLEKIFSRFCIGK
jgi:tRNA modification GTPase